MPFTRPTLLLDERRCRDNIRRMSAKAGRHGIRLRPHFKTHQSLAVGRWFRDEGVAAITVSCVDMAACFAADGWRDITIAFPVNPHDAGRIDRLAAGSRLCCLVESPAAATMLDGGLENRVDMMIKVDTGYGRTGIRWEDEALLDSTVEAVRRSRHLRLAGFLTHAGHSYRAASVAEIARIHGETLARISSVKARYQSGGEDLVASVGDTPCCSLAEDFRGADEIRPGNYVFNDMQQVTLGSCSPRDVAVAVACPVVAIHAARREIIVHGGAVHLSKDTYRGTGGDPVHGQVVELTGDAWTAPVRGAQLVSLSQEHGKIRAPEDLVARISVGDALGVLPAHSCLTANLARGYTTLDGAPLDHLSGREWRRP